ncbi:DUF932 domain-containing protein [Frankia sp. AiPs1]|uniref:DUF932 domain-containing protein n=1 Tax=Frankia sp. AiPs1 TaxID=573493 RepID=UPI0020431A63|nr:DUF932 domain-containing protein [Frankia sp. AiPs1]MCM3921341.1 DUF932 domain-containing protein [Frankia sp. AiPs1]
MTETRSVGEGRNATLDDLVALLHAEHPRKLDIVVPAHALTVRGGDLILAGTDPVLGPDGVDLTDGRYTPTALADEGLATKLDIPLAYLRRTREQDLPLFDANVNAWLRHPTNHGRSFLVRALRGRDGDRGVARAVLSDHYRPVDHLDVLMAALDGVRQAEESVVVDGCDLTDRRMYVRVRSDAVRALAPGLLRGYTSPFTGLRGADNPTVWAGFEITNSETGCGAFTITPRLVVEICRNGMTITQDAIRAVHLGGRLDDGVIRWSADTQHRATELVTAKARDAVATFLDPDYVQRTVARIEQAASTPVDDPAATITQLSTALHFTADQQALILRHFIQGRDLTCGGILQAVTSAAQMLPDADRAHAMEAQAMRALHLAATA